MLSQIVLQPTTIKKVRTVLVLVSGSPTEFVIVNGTTAGVVIAVSTATWKRPTTDGGVVSLTTHGGSVIIETLSPF